MRSKALVSDQQRLDALSRAAVWIEPRTPIASAALRPANEPQQLSCKFKVSSPGGTAPKFDCTLDNGEQIRVKYGRSPEIPSEVASARLLRALGFGADDVMMVERLHCYGCPKEPFVTMKALSLVNSEDAYKKLVNYSESRQFDWVSVEHKHGGQPIETGNNEGWAFFELDRIDHRKGGAPRAHVDALRLLAVFIAHWDNKSENQRLVCLSGDASSGRCATPFAMLHDIGSAFGPRKVDLDEWEKAAIWADRTQCIVTMQSLPYEGATFRPVQIGEAGRRHLATRLGQLSDAQLEDLFAGARFDHATGLTIVPGTANPVADWVRVFKARVRAISDGPPCPPAS